MTTLRRLFLCTFLALILLVVPSIVAQESTFGLSSDDFALLTTANATTGEADSASFEFSASFSVTGTDSDVSANLSGTGAFGGDDATPLFQLTLTGEVVAEGDTTPINAEVRLVGDTLYWSEDGTSWQGQKLEDLLSQFSSMASMMGAGSLPVNPEDLASGDLSGIAGMQGMSEAMAALSNLDPSEFISMTRDDADGLAHFTVNLSISDLLSSPSLAPLLSMAMASGASTGGTQMNEQQMQGMMMVIAGMFAESTVSLEEYVDEATSLIQRVVFYLNLPITDMGGTGAATTVLFNFDISLSGFNEPVTVEAPEGAVILPSTGG